MLGRRAKRQFNCPEGGECRMSPKSTQKRAVSATEGDTGPDLPVDRAPRGGERISRP